MNNFDERGSENKVKCCNGGGVDKCHCWLQVLINL